MAKQKTIKTEQDFRFILQGKGGSDKFDYECESDFDVLVAALWTVVQDDLFTREAIKLVGDFINDEYFKDE